MEFNPLISSQLENVTSESIEQKLEQNEKIIQIYSESLPHLNSNNNNNSTSNSNKSLLINQSPNSTSMPLFPVTFERQQQSSPATTPTTPSSTVTPILKLFAKQLLTLKHCNKTTHSHLYNRHPSLKIWLKLLCISQNTFERLTELCNFHDLYDKNEIDLKVFLSSMNVNANEQDCHVICNAFHNLKTTYKTLEKNVNSMQPPNITVLKQKPNDDSSNSLTVNANTKGLTPSSYLNSSTILSSSSSLLNSSNSNESQLLSSSSTNENKSTERHSDKPKKLNVDTIYTPTTISNLMPQKSNLANRKSESDAPLQNYLQTTSSAKNNELNTNQISPNSSVSFSSTIPNKPNPKKPSGLKVTTPPPSRKNVILNDSPSNNIINVNSHQIQAAAVAAAVKAAVAQQAAAAAATSESIDSDLLVNDNQIIQRSSSHDSHLRNTIVQKPISSTIKQANNNSNVKLSGNNNLNDYCGEHKMMTHSSANTPTTEILNENFLLNPSNKEHSKINPNKIYEIIRRSSIEGSDCSSRGPSGQASPINAQSPTRLTSGIKLGSGGYAFLTDDYCKNSNLSIPKSPKQYHRWKNTLKVSNCGVCKKKMIIGIKCKACKFRCHKECEKKCYHPCSSSIISNLPHVPPCESNNDLNQNIQQTHQSPQANISSSSSTTSSNVPSPALANNNNTQTDENNNQHPWPSGARQVARVANKIVQSINSVSTPKQSHKQLLPSAAENTRNIPESRSDSSCNSSGPNSPNNYKIQLHKTNKGSSQLPVQQINGDKKSTSSSSSISSQYGPIGPNSSSNKLMPNANLTLTPIQSNTSSLSPSQIISNNKSVEFFPPSNLPHPIITKTDESSDNDRLSPNHQSDKTTKEVRESLTLALKKVNNNLSVNDNTENNHLKSYDNNDYESNDQDSNQLNFSQDLKQFNITYEEITDKVEIGRGRFGTVYKAHWHGSHAIKEIDFDENLTESSEELKSFKEEVLNLRKTRHTNLILFVGACMKPPKCAILMSLCRGVSLYKYVHIDGFRPTFDWTIEKATQIAQGMGYLHNKQMIHKDLRSKNIFIDGCKAVIADFGLYSITRLGKKLKKRDLLPITKECVYYMAPELVRLLGTGEMESMFSQASDVFSFGTIWYELFCYEFPFTSSSTETVIFAIGNGLKNISPNIQIPKEFKTILLKCWSKDVVNRPDFSRLLETFRAIPKRAKLFRSPSHPGHIGRSLETLHTPMNDLKN